jgi:hypothetical protein
MRSVCTDLIKPYNDLPQWLVVLFDNLEAKVTMVVRSPVQIGYALWRFHVPLRQPS